MSAYAPQAIQQLYSVIASRLPQAQLGGIVGDFGHSFGYHLARNDLPSTDYSVVLPLDRQGDGGCASALDVTFGEGSPLMVECTSRLLAAAKANDPRLRALREFCGTTDGQHTHPYDLSNGQDGPLDSWDASHLAHIHLSFYRAYANDYAALAPIADVFTGAGTAARPDSSTATKITPPGDDMSYTLYQVVPGWPSAGRQYAVMEGQVPFWLTSADKTAMTRFGWLSNPTKPQPIEQPEIDDLTRAARKGAN